MEYTKLGASALKVSRVALGSTPWDTANAYGNGNSEEIVGRAIQRQTRRENVMLAKALDDIVRAGKVPYIGASSMSAGFISMQDRYSLGERRRG